MKKGGVRGTLQVSYSHYVGSAYGGLANFLRFCFSFLASVVRVFLDSSNCVLVLFVECFEFVFLVYGLYVLPDVLMVSSIQFSLGLPTLLFACIFVS